MSENIKELKREFLEYLEIEKGRSLKTLENYGRYIEKFLGFAKISNPGDINDELVRKYRLFLNRVKTNGGNEIARKTQNYYLIALRMFLKYLAKRGIESLAPEKIELAKITQNQLDLITEEELYRILKAPLNRHTMSITDKSTSYVDSLRALRDKAILELLFSTGLRVSELCSLNRDQISEAKSGEISIRGKGGKIRVVFISENAKQAIKNYLSKRTDTEEALFVRIIQIKDRPCRTARTVLAENSSRLTPRSIERIVNFYAIKAGVSRKVTPHILRHCFATDLLSAGADLRSVQSLLGHSSITTTQIYTHITDKQLREVHKAFHGKRLNA